MKARAEQVTTAVVHIQIVPSQPLAWSARQRAETSQAVMTFARLENLRRVSDQSVIMPARAL